MKYRILSIRTGGIRLRKREISSDVVQGIYDSIAVKWNVLFGLKYGYHSRKFKKAKKISKAESKAATFFPLSKLSKDHLELI